jgi:hypothetical protein
MKLKPKLLDAEQRRISVVDSWNTIHSEMHYLFDHGAFRASSLDQIRSVVASLDDFFVCMRDPQFRVDCPDQVVAVMNIHWPTLESAFDLHDFARLLRAHDAVFRRYLALCRVSVKIAQADTDNFAEFCARLAHATVALSAENHAEQVCDLVAALAFALGLVQGAVDRIGPGEPDSLAKELADVKVRTAQVTDIVQVMERFFCIRDLVRAAARDFFRVMAEQVAITAGARDREIELQTKILEKLPNAPSAE